MLQLMLAIRKTLSLLSIEARMSVEKQRNSHQAYCEWGSVGEDVIRLSERRNGVNIKLAIH